MSNNINTTTKTKKKQMQDIKELRGIGHRLSPIVTVGANGLTPALIEEVSRALNDHELIKIKIPAGDAHARKQCADMLAQATQSEVIHRIGRMVLLLKVNPTPNERLSNLSRFGF